MMPPPYALNNKLETNYCNGPDQTKDPAEEWNHSGHKSSIETGLATGSGNRLPNGVMDQLQMQDERDPGGHCADDHPLADVLALLHARQQHENGNAKPNGEEQHVSHDGHECRHSGLTPELSDAGGPSRPNWQLT